VAILQVKSMPDELYSALRERARSEGMSMSELVIRALHKELARPSIDAWLDRTKDLYAIDDIRPIDSVALLHEVRMDYDRDERFDHE
jgi:hypothetical protein